MNRAPLTPPLPCAQCGAVPEYYCEGRRAYLCCETLACDNLDVLSSEDPVEVTERWNAAQELTRCTLLA